MSAGAALPQDKRALERRGEGLLTGSCSRCHAVGRTSTQLGAPTFRTLGQRYPIEALAEALAEGLSSGHEDMPEFRFDVDDIDAILANLGSIQASGRWRKPQADQGIGLVSGVALQIAVDAPVARRHRQGVVAARLVVEADDRGPALACCWSVMSLRNSVPPPPSRAGFFRICSSRPRRPAAYFNHFQATSPCVVGLVHVSSSPAVNEVIVRFCSVPSRFG